MKHVLLFGGSFDPIHNGHLAIAKQALIQRHADELWFIPTQVSPFKSGGSEFKHRAAMIKRQIAGYKNLKLCSIEASLPSPSYTIDTVKALKKQYPNTRFEWLIGSDQLERLDEWRDINTLKTLVQFIVYARTSTEIETDYPVLKGRVYESSSTAIRNGDAFDTSPSVLRYMTENSLYISGMLQRRLSIKRYDHVMRVCDLALEIAAVHHISEQDVRLSALFHDYCKEDGHADLSHLMNHRFPKQASLAPAFYHAYAAKDYLARRYYIKNRNVLRAILNHVDGKATHPVAMVLYIADKCERGRGWDSEPIIALAKKDLVKGFKTLKQMQNKRRNQKETTV